MSESSPVIDHYLAEYARQSTSLPGAGDRRLAALREAALHAFAEAGFPTPKQEDWKYTRLKTLRNEAFETPETPGTVSADELAAYLPDGLEGPRLVIVDGHYNAQLSSIGDLPDGVELRSMAVTAAERPETVRERVGAQVNGAASALTDMNAAFMSDGLFLELAADARLEAPIHLLVVSSGRQQRAMSQVRHLIRLGPNSQASLIEHHVGLGEAPYFSNAVTEVDLAPGAGLTRVRLQQESGHGTQISSLHARLDKDSSLSNHGVDLGGALVRADTNIRLEAEGAEVTLDGVYAPTGKQHHDNHTRIDHAKPHGTSREFYRGILDGQGRGVFNGKVIVHKHAQKTDSEQSSAALLLSKRAEVDAKPELEIYADDVKCAHGSTVGQLDEDAVFYLRSRGLDEAGARAILTYSFADELIKRIQPAGLRRYIEAALLAKLPRGADYAGSL